MRKHITIAFVGIVCAGLVALAAGGCKKAPPPTPVRGQGVRAALTKLEQSLAGNTNEPVRRAKSRIVLGVRYSQYDKAQEACEAIKADASVNDAQKKLVDDLIEELKAAAEKKAEAKQAAQPAQ
jgi:hypothetical protein